MLKSFFGRKFPVLLLNGTSERVSIAEMWAVIRTWQFGVVALWGILLIATGHPQAMPKFEPLALSVAFWSGTFVVYLVLITVLVFPLSAVWARVTHVPMPLILLSGPAVLITMLISALFVTWAVCPATKVGDVMGWSLYLRTIVVVHAVETLAVAWLLPVQRAQWNELSRPITLAGRTFALGDIKRVKAAEHHLELFTEHGTEVIRERMATFLKQVEPKDGVQPHRSHWVSRNAVIDVSGSLLILPCGGDVPVARGRLKEVQDWCKRYQRIPEGLSAAPGKANPAL